MQPNDTLANRIRSAVLLLLAALVMLQSILVIGLGAFAAVGLREYRAARALLTQMAYGAQGGDSPATAARDLGAELLRRQEAVASRLTKEAAGDERKIAEFQGRLNALYAEKDANSGPIKTADQAIQVMLLMNDQMILSNHMLTQLQAMMAEALRPLPRERDALPGVGGSGNSESRAGKRSPRPK